MQRLMFGALAGVSATMAMTAAMRHLWPRLGAGERYPLPPREIVERATPPMDEGSSRLGSVLAHFGFGAVAGAAYGMLPRQWPSGIFYGISVWVGSYLGWIPALNILKPATRHPFERNLLMLAVHVVWGAVLAASLREIEGAAEEIFAGGPKWDSADNSG